MEKKKIFWVSDSPLLSTGFGRNSLKVCEELVRRGHQVEFLGLQYMGHPLNFGGFVLLPNPSGGLDSGVVESYVQRFKPDFVVSVMDIWNTSFVIDACRRTGVPHINYFPLDGEPIRTDFAALASYSTIALVTSKYSQRVLADKGVFSTVWYNGYDPNVLKFTSFEEKEKLKAELGLKGFVVLSVSRNISRKQVPLLLWAFKKFEDMGGVEKKDVSLILNMCPDEKAGWNLKEIIQYLHIRSPVRFPKNFLSPVLGEDEANVAKYMMASDVHALCSSGEGFGLPVLECMACGTPNVMTDFTAPHELLEDGRGVLVKPSAYIFGQYNYIRAVADVDGMANAFEFLYRNPDKRREMAGKAFEWAKQWTWSHIVDDFEKILDDFETLRLEATTLMDLRAIENWRKKKTVVENERGT